MESTLNRRPLLLLLLLIGVAVLQGCARLPRIDPSGERLLIWPNRTAAPAPALGSASASNAAAPPVYAPGTGPCLGLCDNCRGNCRDLYDWITGSDYQSPTSLAPAPQPAVATVSRPGYPDASEQLSITPERILAPVGSEVVLRAGVCANEGYLRTNRRIEWLLGHEGTGQFVTVGEQGEMDMLRLPWQRPNKHDNTFAVGYTSPFHTCLNRGTADTSDDVQIRPGDAWITVTSASEGASYVTAVAPESQHWEARRATATIYWVDAQWRLPPSAVVQLGQPHTLTTTVTRKSDGAPVAGWIVRYEVVEGPTARLGYEAGRQSQATTDSQGRASLQVTPTDDQPGTAVVKVTVVRPAQSGSMASPELELGGGESVVTWSPSGVFSAGPTTPPDDSPVMPPAPFEPPPSDAGDTLGPPVTGSPLLEVTARRDTVGPVRVDDLVPVTITVVNNGDAPARNIVITDRYDQGLSNALDTARDYEVRYEAMPDLAPGESDSVRLEFTVVNEGRQCHTVTVRADGAQESVDRQCFEVEGAPAPVAPSLGVAVDGELQRSVGETYTFRSRVSNLGSVLAEEVEVQILHDPQLQPLQAEVGNTQLPNGFSWREASIAPGDSVPFYIEYKCLAPNTAARVSIFVRARGSEEVIETRTVEIVPDQEGGEAPAPGPSASPLVGTLNASASPRVGQRASLDLTVSNNGATPLRDVEFRLIFPPQVQPQLSPTLSPYAFRVNQNSYEFDTIPELRAGSPIRLLVPYDPVDQGQVKVRLEMRSPDAGGVQSVETPITIQPR